MTAEAQRDVVERNLSSLVLHLRAALAIESSPESPEGIAAEHRPQQANGRADAAGSLSAGRQHADVLEPAVADLAAERRRLTELVEELGAERGGLWQQLEDLTAERDHLYERLEHHAEQADQLRAQLEVLKPKGLSDHLFSVVLDYPVTPRVRWTQQQPHPELLSLIEGADPWAKQFLTDLSELRPFFELIPAHRTDDVAEHEPTWENDWFPALDGMSLYGMLNHFRPARYFEIGSGHSTRFARKAITDLGLQTTVLSVDPHPRAEIDAICDTVIRSGVEDVDVGMFDELESGDLLLFDGSHRSFQNSDVTVVFTEIIARLQPGVLVAIHDILLPVDYPEQWFERTYNEQYLLACLLLGGDLLRVLLANNHAIRSPALAAQLDALWETTSLEGVPRSGGLFWAQCRTND